MARAKYIIGIDEAGRGPLAGPVAVGGVCIPSDFDFSIFSYVRDSKKLSERAREQTYKEVRMLARAGGIRFAVALIPASTIDTKGITFAVRQGIDRIFTKLAVAPDEVEVRLDGSLKAPPIYHMQETIIKGDATEPAISLASIMAKVTRDRHMVRLAARYPAYGFDIHKGYGTRAHQQALERSGLSDVHRVTFCSRYGAGAVV